MIIKPTEVDGAAIISAELHQDERGFFTRLFCAREFERSGLTPFVVQANLSFNHSWGTLRGLHFQHAPSAEAKLVRCIRGRVFDVVADLRPGSPTFLRHVTVVLDASERNAIFVPEGCAHGYLTLEDNCEVAYHVSEFYDPGAEGGVRWDDPLLGIEWPVEVRVISRKDATWPHLTLPIR